MRNDLLRVIPAFVPVLKERIVLICLDLDATIGCSDRRKYAVITVP
ncbi:hypothetical protein [Methylobacterium gregans]|nr:hypothetical protein [Methylobacterium gregans]MDQ0522764.1 hypothetical protein [Methylobacterium gregans]